MNGEQVERVDNYNHLGTSENEMEDWTKEIQIRIEKARSAFMNMKRILSSRNLSQEIRVWLVKCYIYYIVLYGLQI